MVIGKKGVGAKSSKMDIEDAALDRLYRMLKEEKYLQLNRKTRGFDEVPVTRELLRAIRKNPFTGFVPVKDVEDYLYRMTAETVKDTMFKLSAHKPEGSTTERTALVFDVMERYETGMKGLLSLIENNRYASKRFIDSEAFKDIWRDVISTSQVLTMTSLADMQKFMDRNNDLDETEIGVLRGVVRR
ncbi:MAG: hypothetical protein M1569_02860 [Candidatus Marsarchaeota archaeon]|nr:hypothetical protein [Candidatus Marsarchaeota archaeon]MCL5413318.1 hypothetical protein [Candidatus Marsarchaeota archaeon]